MSDPQGVEDSVDVRQDEIRAAYQIAYSRYQSNMDVLWRVIAFTLAAEAALWVAIVRSSDIPTWGEALLGMGLLLLGLAGPQTVNFIENVSMMDRQLLDVYEERLNLPVELRMFHGMRFAERYPAYVQKFTEMNRYDAVAALQKRRLDKADSGKKVRLLQVFLDLVGQPSIVWTAVISAAGSVGFIAATGTKLPLWLEIPADVLASVVVVTLWFIANGWFARFREFMSWRRK